MVQKETRDKLDEDGFFNLGLDDILVIDLNKAISSGDPNYVKEGMNPFELQYLVAIFNEACSTSVATPTERKIKHHGRLSEFLEIMADTLEYAYLEDLTQTLIDEGYRRLKLGKEFNEKNVKALREMALQNKEDFEIFSAVYENQKPLSEKVNRDNIYTSIATLSLATGINLDSTTLTALEFCSFVQALNKKNKSEKNE